MPKETVSTQYTDLDAGIQEAYTIAVGWSKDQLIEIRTERIFAGWAGGAITEYPERTVQSVLPLTRRQVNDLVRALRKARDSAFGGDA